MAVSLFFGLPGAGKTTILTKIAYDAIRKGRYPNVYTNVHLNLPGVTYIDNDCIGKYELRDCLVLIDEATLFADSRSYKTFDRGKVEYFLEHRHRCADIMLFTQQWNGVDLKIRSITDRVYYVYKTFWSRNTISKYYRIPYGIIIPDKKNGNEKLGEIIQGYSQPHWIFRLFAHRVKRELYYPYFDSWELTPLPDLPDKYKPVPVDPYIDYQPAWAWQWVRCGRWLKRKQKQIRKDRRRQRIREFIFGKDTRSDPATWVCCEPFRILKVINDG